jgi:hypothetical protein
VTITQQDIEELARRFNTMHGAPPMGGGDTMANLGQGIQVGAPSPFGGRPPVPVPRPPGVGGGAPAPMTGMGQPGPPPMTGGPAPQLGSLIGQQPGGMGGPGTISSTPLPPPGMPQPPMTPATPMGAPGATGGGTGAGMGAAPGVTGDPSGAGWNSTMGASRPYVPFGQSSNLADFFSQPRPAGTAGMAPQQARQGTGMGPPAPSFGQTHYLMDWISRMFGGGR